MTHRFTKPTDPANDKIIRYETQGMIRSVCFLLPDSTRRFLSYANLVTGETTADGTISLTFTTHTVTLKGRDLLPLLDEFASQMIRSVAGTESRYAAVTEDSGSGPLVTEISVTSAGDDDQA